jgi:hypothetical protein
MSGGSTAAGVLTVLYAYGRMYRMMVCAFLVFLGCIVLPFGELAAFREKTPASYNLSGPVQRLVRMRTVAELRLGRLRESGDAILVYDLLFDASGRILVRKEREQDLFMLHILYSYRQDRLEEAAWLDISGMTNRIVQYFYEDGRLVHTVHNAGGGRRLRKYVFIYNDARQIMELRAYGTGEQLFARSTFLYDQGGRLIQQTEYGESGVYLGKSTWQYNEAGLNTEYAAYKPDGSRDLLQRYTHDERGNVIEERLFKADGTVLGVHRFVYEEFDKHGNWLKRRREGVSSDEGAYIERQNIDYHGNAGD